MKMLDVKSTVIRMKNACDSLIDGLLTAKERINESKDRSREITNIQTHTHTRTENQDL